MQLLPYLQILPNHNGDLGIARGLIEAAADSGADLVKFQTFSADCLVTKGAPLAAYQATTGESDHYEMIRRLELSRADHEHLVAVCDQQGIGFFSTAFDAESATMLVELGQKRFKVPSGEIDNLPLLSHIGSYGYEIIISTGMAEMEEIGQAIMVLEEAGTDRSLITVLQCTTAYPADFAEANLRAMLTMGREFKIRIGYSDHTPGIEASVAAVALGATIIEKHLTLDRSLPGPDQNASLQPEEFKNLVGSIRNVELALGDGQKSVTNGEADNRPVARRSIVASRPIGVGELFDESCLAVKRPGTGISPMRLPEVLGQRARRNYRADEPIDP
ncbi:MAG: N-acetylneuraminate synthase [bacterium]